jgi:hypothetical protein
MSFSSILCLVFVLLGLGLAGIGAHTVLQARASASWAEVAGQITQSEMKVRSDPDGTTYAPLVRYTYVVNGQPLVGDRISFGLRGMSTSSRLAQAFTGRYPVGSTVTVYYDPAAPAGSVLERGVNKHSFIPLAFGLGFAVFGGWFALLFWLFQP